MLDAGHFEGDRWIKHVYNGVSFTYSEGTQMRRLYELLSARLLQYGFEVGVATKYGTEDTPYAERGEAAEGYDMLLGLHSNGAGMGPAQYSHREVSYIIDPNASSETAFLGNSLANVTKSILNITQANVQDDLDTHAEITAALGVGCPIAIIIEHSFHDNPQSAYMLMQTNILEEIADGEASVIYNFFLNK